MFGRWRRRPTPAAEMQARLNAEKAEVDRLRGLLLDERDRTRDADQLRVQNAYLRTELERARALLAARERAEKDRQGEGS